MLQINVYNNHILLSKVRQSSPFLENFPSDEDGPDRLLSQISEFTCCLMNSKIRHYKLQIIVRRNNSMLLSAFVSVFCASGGGVSACTCVSWHTPAR